VCINSRMRLLDKGVRKEARWRESFGRVAGFAFLHSRPCHSIWSVLEGRAGFHVRYGYLCPIFIVPRQYQTHVQLRVVNRCWSQLNKRLICVLNKKCHTLDALRCYILGCDDYAGQRGAPDSLPLASTPLIIYLLYL
jgi:hypothetical protein